MLWLLVLKMLKCVQGTFVTLTEQYQAAFTINTIDVSKILPFSHLTIHNNFAVHRGFFYLCAKRCQRSCIELQLSSGLMYIKILYRT